jgi:hypothetical protein
LRARRGDDISRISEDYKARKKACSRFVTKFFLLCEQFLRCEMVPKIKGADPMGERLKSKKPSSDYAVIDGIVIRNPQFTIAG